MIQYVQILLPTPHLDGFYYQVPIDLQNLDLLGSRLKVPLRGKIVTGLCVAVFSCKPEVSYKLKYIDALCVDMPKLTPQSLKFLFWLKEYFFLTQNILLQFFAPNYLNFDISFDSKLMLEADECKIDTDFKLKSKLSIEQEKSLKDIMQYIGSFQTIVLHGITGSGKGIIYQHIVQNIIQLKGKVLLLLPEIGLATANYKEYCKNFPKNLIYTYHSKKTNTYKQKVWQWAHSNMPGLLIGTRSSIFLELKHLQMIIVDEEHSDSYQQEAQGQYCAKRSSIVLASMHNIPIILGSATPCVETWHKINTKFKYINLNNRYSSYKLPKIEIINTQNMRLKHALTNKVIDNINHALADNFNIGVFLNRKGFNLRLECSSCSKIIECSECARPLVYYKSKQRLLCHYCYQIQQVRQNCAICGANIIKIGQGTEKIVEIVQYLFPCAQIVQLDGNTAGSPAKLEKQLSLLENSNQPSIIVGTELMAKGFNLPKLKLLVVLDVDSYFYNNDFRAQEKLAQQIIQVAGRAGRDLNDAKVLIQTNHSQNKIWSMIINHDYKSIVVNELTSRFEFCLPPYAHQALLTGFSNDENKLELALEKVSNFLNTNLVHGPFPATIVKKKKVYAWHLLIQTPTRLARTQLVRKIFDSWPNGSIFFNIKYKITIDPAII